MKNAVASPIQGNEDSATSSLSKFRALSSAIAELGASIDVTIVPFHDPSLVHFSALPKEQQLTVLSDLESFVDVCHSTRGQGYGLDNGPMLLWNAIKKFGLRPTSDLFQFAHDGNVIEVHNLQFVQIFRNFKFYECCSYSLEELHCLPWPALYQRDSAVEQKLFAKISDFFTGKLTKTIRLDDVEPHIIYETSSTQRYAIRAEVRYGSPLFDQNGHFAATVVIEKGEVFKTAPKVFNFPSPSPEADPSSGPANL